MRSKSKCKRYEEQNHECGCGSDGRPLASRLFLIAQKAPRFLTTQFSLQAPIHLEQNQRTKGANQRPEDVTRTQKQSPKSPMVAITWHASKCQVHILHQKTSSAFLGTSHTLLRKHLFGSIGGKIQKLKGSKERLFIRTQTHNLQIFGIILFIKLQSYT